MKCKDCNACKKGYFPSRPNDYVCIGVKEPFVINDINVECTEYPERRKTPLNDGIYMELFVVKNGVRYNAKIINQKDAAITLTESLMDGVQKLWCE